MDAITAVDAEDFVQRVEKLLAIDKLGNKTHGGSSPLLEVLICTKASSGGTAS